MKEYTIDFRHIDSDIGVRHETLEAVEKKLGHDIPEQYRQFLLAYNGIGFESNHKGNFVDASFASFRQQIPETLPSLDIIDRATLEKFSGEIQSIDRLYPLDECYFRYATRDVDTDVFFGWVPNHIWPIGGNDMGDHICMSFQGEDAGTVYYWSRPEILLEDRNKWLEDDFLNWVSKDFVTFWNSITLIGYERLLELTG